MTYAEAKADMEAAERRRDALAANCTKETLPQFREAHAEYLRLARVAHAIKWEEIGKSQWLDIVDRAKSENVERERKSLCVS